jgi:hypothetical protein
MPAPPPLHHYPPALPLPSTVSTTHQCTRHCWLCCTLATTTGSSCSSTSGQLTPASLSTILMAGSTDAGLPHTHCTACHDMHKHQAAASSPPHPPKPHRPPPPPFHPRPRGRQNAEWDPEFQAQGIISIHPHFLRLLHNSRVRGRLAVRGGPLPAGHVPLPGLASDEARGGHKQLLRSRHA